MAKDLYDEYTDPGLLATIPDYIDEKVHSGLKAGYRGGLAVLASGFGKGMLAAAAIFVAGTVIATIASPTLIGLAANASFGAALEGGLAFAATQMLTNGLLWAGILLTGCVGSITEAHSENAMISKEAAEERAFAYKQARECSERANQENISNQQSNQQSFDCPNSNCARFMKSEQQRNEQNQQQAGYGR